MPAALCLSTMLLPVEDGPRVIVAAISSYERLEFDDVGYLISWWQSISKYNVPSHDPAIDTLRCLFQSAFLFSSNYLRLQAKGTASL